MPIASFNAQIELLKSQIKTLETEASEKDERIRLAVSEKDRYAGLVQKLESKIKPQSEELVQLRKQLEQSVEKLEMVEKDKEELEANFEVLTLERVFSTEAHETLQKENEDLVTKVEDLELRVEILEEEKTAVQELVEGETDPENIIYLKIENERMREALLKLRDTTRNEKKEDDTKIKQLEEENAHVKKLNEELAVTRSKLDKAEETIELQKTQIDSTESQELVVMDLQSKYDAQQAVVKELEIKLDCANTMTGLLKDEMAIYLEDINKYSEDFTKWYEIAQLGLSDIIKLKRTVADQDMTIEKFRQWSSELKTNLVEAEGNQEVSQQEQAKLEKRAQQYKELAEKTQKSATRTQHASLQQALDKARAEVVERQNIILKAYTRKGFESAIRPIEAVQLLVSINLKTEALQQYIRAKADQSYSSDNEADKLCRPKCVSQLGHIKLVSAFMDIYFKTAHLSTFLKFGEAHNELAIMEKNVDTWIDSLIKDNLGETELMEQSRKNINFIKHVVEKYIPGPTGLSCGLDTIHQLEHIGIGLDSIKIHHVYLEEILDDNLRVGPDSDELDRDQYEEHKQAIIKNRKILQSTERHAQNALEQVRDLKERRMTVNEQIRENIDLADHGVHEILDTTFRICQQFSKIINEERDEPLTFLDIRPAVGNTPYEAVTENLTRLIKIVYTAIESLNDSNNLDEILEEDTKQPWIEHNIALDAEEADLRDVALELTTAKADLVEKNTAIAVKNKTIEELNVSVEVLNKRINDSGTKNDKVVDLERVVKASAERENTLNLRINTLVSQLKKSMEEPKESPVHTSKIPLPVTSLAQRADINVVKRQNEALTATLRAAVIKNHNVVDFEQLDQPKKPELTLEERTAATLQTVYAARKKENKKKSMARKKREAEGALHGFRRAMWR